MLDQNYNDDDSLLNESAQAQEDNSQPVKYDYSEFAPKNYDYSEFAPKQEPAPQSSQSQQQTAPRKQSFVDMLAQSNPVQAILGFGDALQELPYQVGNIVNQAVGLPPAKIPQTGQGLAYTLGNALGYVAPYSGVEKAIMSTPKALSLGEKIAGRMLAGTTYGAIMTPENRTKGALEGGAITGALEGLGAIPRGIKALSSGAQNHADQIVKVLGQGRSNTENLQELAQDIGDAGRAKQDLSSQTYFDPLSKKYGNSNIYKGIEERNYNPNDYLKDIFNKKLPGDVSKAHQEFMDNPTYDNAHKLQSTLATAERAAYSPTASMQDKADLGKVRGARKNLLLDINNLLSKSSPDDAALYKEGAIFHYNEVTPYKVNSDIRDIVSGNSRDVDLSRLPNILKKTSDVSAKIAEDIGESGRNKVLYHEIAKSKNLTPEKLSSILSDENLRAARLDQFAPEELSPLVKSLQSKISRPKWMQKGIGAIAAVHGAPRGGALSALLGAELAPKAFKSLGDIGRNLIPENVNQNFQGVGGAIRQLLMANLTK